jgi:hypothetical protein
MIMRINPYVGISGMRRYVQRQKKMWLRGIDDVLVVGLHMVGKRMKFRLSTTWHPSLHFIFLSLDSSLSFLSCHSSSLFFFFFSFFSITLLHSLIHIYFFFTSHFSFFLFHTHIFHLTFPSLHIFISLLKALNSSLSCIKTIWNLK